MNRKIPPDAFSFYYSLGTGRTYRAVAQEYGVTKQAVAKLAAKDGWQARVQRIDQQAAERTEAQLTETVEAMNVRHIKMLKLVQGRALEALKVVPLTTAMEAVRSLDMSIRQERLARGEATDRNVLSVEEVVKREYDNWMTSPGEKLDRSGEGTAEVSDDDNEQ